mmetsp:Transcript_36227/g.117106  ORF Transcript_36227/g.117106 Transcript_36227/m.117106 type:complete len:102 (+) Transcript_36227:961-1266(+)
MSPCAPKRFAAASSTGTAPLPLENKLVFILVLPTESEKLMACTKDFRWGLLVGEPVAELPFEELVQIDPEEFLLVFLAGEPSAPPGDPTMECRELVRMMGW